MPLSTDAIASMLNEYQEQRRTEHARRVSADILDQKAAELRSEEHEARTAARALKSVLNKEGVDMKPIDELLAGEFSAS